MIFTYINYNEFEHELHIMNLNISQLYLNIYSDIYSDLYTHTHISQIEPSEDGIQV